jgi:hypothetical protein
MGLAADLEECLRRFNGADSVEVRENGARVATVEKFSWELRGAPAQPILRLSLEQYSATHRILAIRKGSDVSLTLSIERFGTAKPGRLEFVRVDYTRPPREVARQEFSSRLARILSERFPDDLLESLKIAPDLEHSFSSNYARGVLRNGSARWALLAVPDSETMATSENSLTFGLLWLAHVCETAREGYVAGLRLIVAQGAGAILIHLVKALSSSVAVEIYEFDPRNESLTRVDPNALANHATWLVQPRERQSLLGRAAAEIDPIVAISPQAITLHPNIQNGEIMLRFRGLAFACWENCVVYFGAAGGRRKKLTASTQAELKQILHDLEIYRHPLATDTRHPLYRSQPERWLETIVRNDVTRVDATLDPRFVYTQLFANSATERGILDILTVTTSGRLAIIELKASEHIHLPLQAADYWLRIRHHLEQGDFSRYGYFPQLQLQKTPPLVFLVAPALRFHSTTGPILRYLPSSIEVVRVGVAESWRRGIRVVMRQ